MIDLKPAEEEKELSGQFLESGIVKEIAIDKNIANELHSISKTLKGILDEMRKRK